MSTKSSAAVLMTLATFGLATVSRAADIPVSGDITANTTWTTGNNYIVTGNVNVAAAGNPLLTIQAGVTVKFNSGAALYIGSGQPGNLSAVGTAGAPIVFTANGSTSPGFWAGINIVSQASTTTTVRFATVTYATKGIYVQQSSPTIRNVTLQNNTTGLDTFLGTPVVLNCAFSGNGNGFTNQAPTTVVDARMNWWNHLSGPSGSGPGSGQSVATGIKFEPWLGTAPQPNRYFSAFSLGNSTFNPNIGINANFSFTTLPAGSGSWTFRVYNGATPVRTITGTGTSGTLSWNGQNGSGQLQGNGTYTYTLDCTGGGNAAAPLRGRVTLNTNQQFGVNNLVLAPTFFSPNADGVQDTATVTAVATFDGASWTVNVKNSGGTTVRTATGPANPNISYVWDGKNAIGDVQLDGIYTFQLIVTDGPASVTLTPTTTLDRLIPVAAITAPAAGATLSNVSQTSSPGIVGSASDLNMDHWALDNLGVASIASGTANVTNSTLGTWQTFPLNNQSYTVQLKVWDRAGNTTTVTRQYVVGHFKIALGATSLNGSAGGTVTLTSTVPFTMTETLFIRNSTGQTVRTLVNGASRAAGIYNDIWNGKNGSGALQPDGAYFSIATVTAGGNNLTWDLTNQPWNGPFYFGHTQSSTWDPFNNQPLVINYNFPVNGRVSIAFTPNADIQSNCPPPDFCVVFDRYEQAGPHTYYWAGIDSTGRYRPDAKEVEVVLKTDTFPQNGMVLYGTKVIVTGVTATPTSYSPAAGSQTIGFTLATYLSLPANVTITFLNQESMSVLRTISLPLQSAGPHTTTWDGRSENGMLVAPGTYLVTVSATDSMTTVGVGQIMTRVGY